MEMIYERTSPELILWRCLEVIDHQEELQALTTESMTLGPQSSQAARSMLWSLFSILHPHRIVEIGTSHGLTSAFMWSIGRSLGDNPKVITCDVAESALAPRLWERLGAAPSITFVRGDSGTMIPKVSTDRIDLALIDGDHSYIGAQRDWEAIEPRLLSRSAVYFDNMDHIDGCGEFFVTLSPLWFHPAMAISLRGFSDTEVQAVFQSYANFQFPFWLRGIPARQGDKLRDHFRNLRRLLQQPLANPARGGASDLCRELSRLAANPDALRGSELKELSARYNIGTLANARRQRIIEAIPAPLRSWIVRAYHTLRRQAGGRVFRGKPGGG